MVDTAAAPPSAPPARERFEALDACRGFCAVAVVLFHLNPATHFARLWSGGYVAVIFFFVLSGFVIARAYQGTIHSVADLGRFSLRRFGRLYPLHLFVLALYVGLELWRWSHHGKVFTGTTSVPALIANLFLVQGFTLDSESWNFPAWSISVELWTNLAFGLLMLLCARRIVAGAAITALALLGVIVFQRHLPSPFSPAETEVLLNVAQYVLAFFVGVLTYALYQAARRTGWRGHGALDAAALLITLSLFGFADQIDGLAQIPLFAAVVFIFAFETGAVSRFLKHPACVRLGTVSFSIYLTHSLYTLAAYLSVLAVGRHLGQTAMVIADGRELLVLGGPWVMDAVALACVAAVIAGAHLTYRFIEEPGRRMFNRLAAPPGRA